MRKIRFGRTGEEIPTVSVGTWGHSGPKVVSGRPVGWSGSDDSAAAEALVNAYEAGITHWDTADVYGDGRAEAVIGSLWESVPRDQIFLASKVGWDPGSYGHFYHPDQIRSQMERSLRKLQTDRIDLYYFHHCDFGPDDRYLDDAIEVVRRFRDDGKIRFVGLSDWDSGKISRIVERVDPDVVQPYRNVTDDGYAGSDLETWVQEHDLGVAFFSPIKHGLLLGNYTEPVHFDEGDHRNRNPGFRDARLLEHLRYCRDEVTKRFATHPEPVLQALLGVLLADTPTACVLLGMRRPSHVASAAAVGEPLSLEDASWVRDLYQGRLGPLPDPEASS